MSTFPFPPGAPRAPGASLAPRSPAPEPSDALVRVVRRRNLARYLITWRERRKLVLNTPLVVDVQPGPHVLEAVRAWLPAAVRQVVAESDPPCAARGGAAAGPCVRPFMNVFVGADRLVRPCRFADRAPRFALGDLHRETPHDVWNGTAAQELREAHLSGRAPEPCLRCVVYGPGPFVEAEPGLFDDYGPDLADMMEYDEAGALLSVRADELLDEALSDRDLPLPDRLRRLVDVMQAAQAVAARLRSAGGAAPARLAAEVEDVVAALHQAAERAQSAARCGHSHAAAVSLLAAARAAERWPALDARVRLAIGHRLRRAASERWEQPNAVPEPPAL